MSNEEGPRFVDLSRLDDLKNPIYRLSGIADYCRTLRYYGSAAEHFWKAQRQARAIAGGGWTSLDPTTQEYDRAQINVVEALKKQWDDYYTMLSHLYKAAAPLMPEVFPKLKVLNFGPKPLHYDQQTNWQAFEDDLAAILAQAEVLRAKAEGTMPDAAEAEIRLRNAAPPPGPAAPPAIGTADPFAVAANMKIIDRRLTVREAAMKVGFGKNHSKLQKNPLWATAVQLAKQAEIGPAPKRWNGPNDVLDTHEKDPTDIED